MLDEPVGRNRLEELRNDPGTGGTAPSGVHVTATEPASNVLTEEFGFIRNRVKVLSEDVDESHRSEWVAEWRQKTMARGKASPQDMLTELAEHGFAWRDIARMLQVSVPAVQKWRRGDGCSGPSRLKIASLLAACDLVTEHYEVQEIASWFETPLMLGVPVTPMDFFAADQTGLIFELAGGHVDPEQILTWFDENWREKYRSDFEVFEAGDGALSIRSKAR